MHRQSVIYLHGNAAGTGFYNNLTKEKGLLPAGAIATSGSPSGSTK